MSREIVVLPDSNTIAHEAAERFVTIAREAIAAQGRFTVALSGGATPRPLYSLLASEAYRARIEWDRLSVFWGDERCVPPDHPDSDFGMARDLLLSKAPIPAGNVHRMRGEIDPEQAASEYEQIIRREVPAAPGSPPGLQDSPGPGQADSPVIDLILLGMGADGHTASLFPGTPALHERTRLVVADYVPKLSAHRLTFTPKLINAAAHVTFLVVGADKAGTLRAVLEGEFRPDVLPAQIVRPVNGKLTWLVDRAAAHALSFMGRELG